MVHVLQRVVGPRACVCACGRVIHCARVPLSPCPPPTPARLWQNMVPPGDVDEDLKGETQEECSKYGPVKQVLIHEVSAASLL